MDKIVLGYYPGYERFDQEKIPWTRLTHLCHAFITSDENGVIEINEHVPSRSLTSLAATHRVPVILSVGGWGDADGFEQATSTPEKMAIWVKDLVAIVVENQYSGLDVDWEFPRNKATRDKFTELLRAIRSAFDKLEQETGAHYYITSAVTARPAQGKWIDGPAIEPAIDFLNVMTYDFAGPWGRVAAHHAPLKPSPKDPAKDWRSVEGAMQYWEQVQKFPKRKLNVGIPLYGRRFPVREPYASLANAPEDEFGTPEFKEISQLTEAGWRRQIDPDCRAPWLLAPNDQRGVIAYDDVESATAKSQWAKEAGYRGIFFWAIGHDYLPDGRHHLVEPAAKVWNH